MTHNRLRVLFVCTMNRDRSPTAEHLYRGDPGLEVRSAGVSASASHPLSEADLHWADVVFVMEIGHKRWIQSEFRNVELPPIEVLGIPDGYAYGDPGLQEVLREAVDPELAFWRQQGRPEDPAEGA